MAKKRTNLQEIIAQRQTKQRLELRPPVAARPQISGPQLTIATTSAEFAEPILHTQELLEYEAPIATETYNEKIASLRSLVAHGDIKLLMATDNPQKVLRLAVTERAIPFLKALDIPPAQPPLVHYKLGENSHIYSKHVLFNALMYSGPANECAEVAAILDTAEPILPSILPRVPFEGGYEENLATLKSLIAEGAITTVMSPSHPDKIIKIAATGRGAEFLDAQGIDHAHPVRVPYFVSEKIGTIYSVAALVAEFACYAPHGRLAEIGDVIRSATKSTLSAGLDPKKADAASIAAGFACLNHSFLEHGPFKSRLQTRHIQVAESLGGGNVKLHWPSGHDADLAKLVISLMPEGTHNKAADGTYYYDTAALAEVVNRLAAMADETMHRTPNMSESCLHKLGHLGSQQGRAA